MTMTLLGILAVALQQESTEKITHAFLVAGGETYVVNGDDTIRRRYPQSTRDGWVLPDGHLLLAVSKGREYPSGAVVDVDAEGKKVFEFKGTQSEVDTVQPLASGNILLTESGKTPRLLEVDRSGKVVVEVALRCQTQNPHMETRMARKLANGNYLVPHLLDHVVREYTPGGATAWEASTPEEPRECWPFTAIRLENGNTLVNLTHGNRTVEFDATGKIVWQVTNEDLAAPLFRDPCGAQRLPNGNTVIASYGQGGKGVKLFEVTREKKVVWTWTSDRPGVHQVQVIETNGKPLDGAPLR
ncbi:MAG TPA: PQQ-binding-like beta-propeller repeat protein [Planctomycetota bacterium]|nr:PQQ-binding-like beta-propeller repeat protein [Planctomycetota bacterium]